MTATMTWTEARLDTLQDAYLALCGGVCHEDLIAPAAREEGSRLNSAINYLRRRNLRGE